MSAQRFALFTAFLRCRCQRSRFNVSGGDGIMSSQFVISNLTQQFIGSLFHFSETEPLLAKILNGSAY